MQALVSPAGFNKNNIMRTEEQKAVIRRKMFVRRTYKRYPVLALLFIKECYPDYTEEQMFQDLKVKKRYLKPWQKHGKKKKQIRDFRRVQIEKHADRLKWADKDSKEYHQSCNMIVILETAHSLKRHIELPVRFKGVEVIYSFHWATSDREIREFVALANKAGSTHEILKKAQSPSFTGN